MKLSRVQPFEWLTGALGLALIAGLFMPWSGGESALAAPGPLDLMLALIGLLAALIPAVVASSVRTNVPVVYETLLWIVSLLFGLAMVVKVVFPPDGGYETGFWLVLAATLLTGVSLWRSVAREE